jgi:hypothetical protein
VSEVGDPVDPAFVREFVESTVSGPVPPAFLEAMIGESWEEPERVAADVVALAERVRPNRHRRSDTS